VAQSAAAFRLFGFPVHVRPGFLIFMALVVMINGPEFGVSLAVFMAIFTLIHELGHAFAARATGARAEISLDFLAGYASFVPTRPLLKWERVGISFAGPAAQIMAGTLTYIAVGGRTLLPEHEPLQTAAWWAGPVIGIFNLIPILPFDGGNIVEVGIEAITPRHARDVMYWVTIVIAGGGIVYMLMHPELRPLVFFAAIPLVTVAQMMGFDRERARRKTEQEAAARAEALAWATGDVRAFPPTFVPSPWYRAWQQLRDGDTEVARQVLVADFGDIDAPRWWPPDAAPTEALRELAALLPRPLPVGTPFSTFVLGDVLLRTGSSLEAGSYAAAAYGATRSPMLAVLVARAAAASGDRDTAMAWLDAAARDADPDALRSAVSRAPELASLR
jgi:Zn-dependent protease